MLLLSMPFGVTVLLHRSHHFVLYRAGKYLFMEMADMHSIFGHACGIEIEMYHILPSF
jgi:hypothetical protein